VSRLDAAGWQAAWHAEEPPAGLVLAARTRMQLTRVLREAVSNAIRHSGGRRCHVRIGFADGGMQIEVQDDGRGLPDGMRQQGAGHGLPNIERRVRSLGGRHSFERPEGGGTQLTLEIPLAVRSANIDAL
jgi:signal transduction histidine kinase